MIAREMSIPLSPTRDCWVVRVNPDGQWDVTAGMAVGVTYVVWAMTDDSEELEFHARFRDAMREMRVLVLPLEGEGWGEGDDCFSPGNVFFTTKTDAWDRANWCNENGVKDLDRRA